MSTARLIAKSLSTSEKRARLQFEAGPLAEFCQALYPLIIAHSDDFGRLDGSVFHVKHAIEPTSPRSVEEFTTALLALDRVRLVDWYVVDSKLYLQVIDFKRHQPGLKQRNSKLPEFSNLARRVTPALAVECREIPHHSNLFEPIRFDSKSSGAENAPPPPRPVEIPHENLGAITKLAHEVIHVLGTHDIGDLAEALKNRCADLRIVYDSRTVAQAIDSAIVQQRSRGPTGGGK